MRFWFLMYGPSTAIRVFISFNADAIWDWFLLFAAATASSLVTENSCCSVRQADWLWWHAHTLYCFRFERNQFFVSSFWSSSSCDNKRLRVSAIAPNRFYRFTNNAAIITAGRIQGDSRFKFIVWYVKPGSCSFAIFVRWRPAVHVLCHLGLALPISSNAPSVDVRRHRKRQCHYHTRRNRYFKFRVLNWVINDF